MIKKLKNIKTKVSFKKELKKEGRDPVQGTLLDRLKRFTKKYDYDINHVIGVKGSEKYIVHFDRKIIRIYRGKTLKGPPLLCSYIPIEQAIFYSFETESNVIDKFETEEELREYIETEVYRASQDISETEEYIIKYKIVRSLRDEKKVAIETVIVPGDYLRNGFRDILDKTGYIDYLSFPAFSFAALYNEILTEANDVFVVILQDKTFLAFYSAKELLTISTVTFGLNRIYEDLKEKLNIQGFDTKTFEKLITKKGLNPYRYREFEKPVFELLQERFEYLFRLIQTNMGQVVDRYNIPGFERMYVITQFGDVPGTEEFCKQIFPDMFVAGFDFYEKYNLDRLQVEPFLFLAMVETHYAYKRKDLTYNFSLYLRKPTFFFRPSGQLIGSVAASLIVLGVPLLGVFGVGLYYSFRANAIADKKIALSNQKRSLDNKLKGVVAHLKKVEKKNQEIQDKINLDRDLVRALFKFKYGSPDGNGSVPVSQDLTDLAYWMNRSNVFLKSIHYNGEEYNLTVYTQSRYNIPLLLAKLKEAGFYIFTPRIFKEGKFYVSTIFVTHTRHGLEKILEKYGNKKKGKKR